MSIQLAYIVKQIASKVSLKNYRPEHFACAGSQKPAKEISTYTVIGSICSQENTNKLEKVR